MEAWREELYLQHGLFDNLRQKVKSAASVVRSTASNAYATVKKTSNTAANSIKTKAGDINREWKNHKYIRKEEKGNKVRYIYPEDKTRKTNIRKRDTGNKNNKADSRFLTNKIVQKMKNAVVEHFSDSDNKQLKYYSKSDILNRSSKGERPFWDISSAIKDFWIDIRKKSLENISELTDFRKLKKKTSKFTADEDQKKVNPLYKTQIETIDGFVIIADEYSEPYSTNCAYCSAAYELRRRGYDVEALPDDDGDGTLITDIENWFKDTEFEYEHAKNGMHFSRNESIAMAQHLLYTGNFEPGARGFLSVQWSTGGGHSMIWEISDNGGLLIRDCQTDEKYGFNVFADDVMDIYEVFGRSRAIGSMRTDYKKLSPQILKAVRNSENYDDALDKKRQEIIDQRDSSKIIKSEIIYENDDSVVVRVQIADGSIERIRYNKINVDGAIMYEESIIIRG